MIKERQNLVHFQINRSDLALPLNEDSEANGLAYRASISDLCVEDCQAAMKGYRW